MTAGKMNIRQRTMAQWMEIMVRKDLDIQSTADIMNNEVFCSFCIPVAKHLTVHFYKILEIITNGHKIRCTIISFLCLKCTKTHLHTLPLQNKMQDREWNRMQWKDDVVLRGNLG
jgi:hypothetical protein